MSANQEDQEMPSASELSEAPSPSDQDIEPLEKRLAQAEEEKKEAHEKYLRIYAEFENFKKRIAKEQSDQNRYANERLLAALLPVLDNLARAISHAKESKNLEKLIEGLELTQKEFLSVLNKFGVTVIESLGQPFDPAQHQAMLQVETDDQEENTVVEEFQKGYLLNNRVLRPALVSVAKNTKQGSSLHKQKADETATE
jgi:molecular chaperone GrpE